jgi:histidinol phosphatase-like enzyme
MQSPAESLQRADPRGGHSVFIDLDTVLLAEHQGRRGVELAVQADLAEGIDRLSEVAQQIVVLAHPPGDHEGSRLSAERRVAFLRDALGPGADHLLIVVCTHEAEPCTCAKPGSGLIDLAIEQHGLPRGGWYVGADQEGVVSGRGAGLRTVRIGPLGIDHLSTVHRADYEARDLLDAANHILVEELA